MDKEQKRAQILKQAPILKKLPKEEQVRVYNQAARSPLVWITFILLFGILIYTQADLIIDVSMTPDTTNSILRNFLSRFTPLILPVILPSLGIIALVVFIRNSIIKREVNQYLNSHG